MFAVIQVLPVAQLAGPFGEHASQDEAIAQATRLNAAVNRTDPISAFDYYWVASESLAPVWLPLIY